MQNKTISKPALNILIIHLPFLELSIIIFKDIKMKTCMWVIQKYRAWFDCMNMQAGMALYWWQRLPFFVPPGKVMDSYYLFRKHLTVRNYFWIKKNYSLYYYLIKFVRYDITIWRKIILLWNNLVKTGPQKISVDFIYFIQTEHICTT